MGLIKENQKVKLKFKLEDNSEHELECFIKGIGNDRLALTFSQEHLPYAKYLEEGSEIYVNIFTPTGITAFNSMVLDSPLETDFVIEYIEDNIDIQRRDYLRCYLQTKFIIERFNGQNLITQTIDIGGGGIKFYSEGTFKPDEHAICRLYLPMQISSIQAEGKITYKPHLKTNEHLFVFTNIKMLERDKIIKKCFDMQTADNNEGYVV